MLDKLQYRRKSDVCIGDLIMRYRRDFKVGGSTLLHPHGSPFLVIEKRNDKHAVSKMAEHICMGWVGTGNLGTLCWLVLNADGALMWFDYSDIEVETLCVISRC
jgi:hypothetical protein